MEQQIFDETNGLWYERHGDYYFPLPGIPAAPSDNDCPISRYANMRLCYLKEHVPLTLSRLILDGTLHNDLTSIEQDAQSRIDTLILQMKTVEGITEELKAQDQMAWVAAMMLVPKKSSWRRSCMDNIQLLRVDNTIAVMRLMVEGAVSILEDETIPLLRLALEKKMNQEASAFGLLVTVLYELRTHIRELQTECEEHNNDSITDAS